MNETYIIGEIGQNHNGSVDLAKLLVEMAAREIENELFDLHLKGMNAVKLTKRDLREELSQSQMSRPYTSAHSFGATYGEHRDVLELSDEEHFEVYKHAKAFGMDFVETLCAKGCLSMLRYFTPDRLKVASRDLTNLPLLAALAETKIPIILSTGMAGKQELDEALDVITRYHDQISILHCVSEYPTKPENVNLNTIRYLQKHYPQYTIGFSDHTIGIAAPVAAVAMGARIIEKHITLDRSEGGVDAAFSLEPAEFASMVRESTDAWKALGVPALVTHPGQLGSAIFKRSVYAACDIEAGSPLTTENLRVIRPAKGIPAKRYFDILGKTASRHIAKGTPIQEDFFSEQSNKQS
jgi:sialic acid synthase